MPEPTDREVILESRLAEANTRIAELISEGENNRAKVAKLREFAQAIHMHNKWPADAELNYLRSVNEADRLVVDLLNILHLEAQP